jgi:hypothetical protein
LAAGFCLTAFPFYECGAAKRQSVGRQPSILYQLLIYRYRATIRRDERASAETCLLLTEERVIRASLKELVTDGQLGPIRLGIVRAVIAELLGEPDDYSSNSRARQRKRLPPAIWKYGDIELHFTDATNRLYLIFLEHFTIPSGGSKLELDPWIIQQSLTAE